MMPPLSDTITRIGLLGGTFDPIHFGHLSIAEEARVQYGLDAVWFVPTSDPPHKPRWQAAPEQRFIMTHLAVADHPQFTVSRIELDRPGRSYSVDTLNILREQYPQVRWHFIMGADAALDFPHWRQPEEILDLAEIVVATRPGFNADDLRAGIPPAIFARLKFMSSPGLHISSSDLRARLQAGCSVRYLIPDPVIAFIVKEGLYAKA